MTNLNNARPFFWCYLTTELQANIDLDTLELQEGRKVTQAFQQLHLRIRLILKIQQTHPKYNKVMLIVLLNTKAHPIWLWRCVCGSTMPLC
jgi:hypothetical protein